MKAQGWPAWWCSDQGWLHHWTHPPLNLQSVMVELVKFVANPSAVLQKENHGVDVQLCTEHEDMPPPQLPGVYSRPVFGLNNCFALRGRKRG